MNLFPLVIFEEIPLEEANEALLSWGHKMGPINRPMNGTVVSGGGDTAHGLRFEGQLVGLTVTSTLISPNVAGRLDLTRDNTIELSRLCSSSPHLCRLVLRMWREFVFRPMRWPFAISYQDAKLHSGDTYRFDGWKQIGKSRSGTDTRSGRPGRSKVIWMFEKDEK